MKTNDPEIERIYKLSLGEAQSYAHTLLLHNRSLKRQLSKDNTCPFSDSYHCPIHKCFRVCNDCDVKRKYIIQQVISQKE